MSTLNVKNRLIETAKSLFYERGINNVGINEITAAADVARMSLYNNFDSKDDLVRAVLEYRLGRKLESLRAIEGLTLEPRDKLLKVIEQHTQTITRPVHRGCAFINASVESGAQAAKVRDLHLRQKEAIRSTLERLATEARLEHPEGLSHQLMLLLDGASVTALVRDPELVGEQLLRAARTLITAADHPR